MCTDMVNSIAYKTKVNGWHSSWFKVLSGIKYTGNSKVKDNKVGKI